MRALTIRQPWASLIIAGMKDVENRTWPTKHRGPLAIHAAVAVASPAEWEHAEMVCKTVAPKLMPLWSERVLPRGVVLGTVNLASCELGCDCSPWSFPEQYHFGLESADPFVEPVPATGALGIWEWRSDHSAARVGDQP